ncbi:hypothetical protein PAP_02015 [Palaeococcus pacificus DY20341]|uniref:Uncharacterized protein n=1 Tax=Palaeococcus pacificus DY20341 TaxID=1343739 RepID=A0A075LQ59_9EURY|nr:hypothetical protein [Palaeococcus pacificus]AIF68835.1 hypothetical protein PAP_02015 [Palaeococcus pacificus DY20341]
MWRKLLGLMLSLLVLSTGLVTAKPSQSSIEPQAVVAAALEAYITGDIVDKTIIHLIFYDYKHYKVKHNTWGSIVVGIGKLPIGGYKVWISVPDQLQIEPSRLQWRSNPVKYEGTTKKWGITFHKFDIQNSGWAMSSFSVPIKFTVGKDKSYGILLLGAQSYDEIDSFIGNAGTTLIGAIVAGVAGAILGLLAGSGISYDYVKITEV